MAEGEERRKVADQARRDSKVRLSLEGDGAGHSEGRQEQLHEVIS